MMKEISKWLLCTAAWFMLMWIALWIAGQIAMRL